MTCQEAADMLGLSRRTLDRWRQENRGCPFTEVTEGCIRYSRKALEQWLADKTRHPEG